MGSSMLLLWLRRIHMYAALFLVPWVVIYAVSTLVMNHAAHFGGPPPAPVFVVQETRARPGAAVAGEGARQSGARLLADLGQEGKFRAQRDGATGRLVVTRDHPLGPQRFTHDP